MAALATSKAQNVVWGMSPASTLAGGVAEHVFICMQFSSPSEQGRKISQNLGQCIAWLSGRGEGGEIGWGRGSSILLQAEQWCVISGFVSSNMPSG